MRILILGLMALVFVFMALGIKGSALFIVSAALLSICLFVLVCNANDFFSERKERQKQEERERIIEAVNSVLKAKS